AGWAALRRRQLRTGGILPRGNGHPVSAIPPAAVAGLTPGLPQPSRDAARRSQNPPARRRARHGLRNRTRRTPRRAVHARGRSGQRLGRPGGPRCPARPARAGVAHGRERIRLVSGGRAGTLVSPARHTHPMSGKPPAPSARPPQDGPHEERMPLSRWPTLARRAAGRFRWWGARHNAAPRRAFVVTASLQLALLAVLALVSAARPYDGIWLRLAAATWCLWLWPLARLGLMLARLTACLTLCAPRRAARERSIAAVAEELDRLNPEAPDVFRTAMRPEAHAPATRDALEDLYARWEPRLRIPAPP